MMKTASVLLLSILGSALATPAVVWKNGQRRTEEAGVRTSKSLKASDLLSEVLSSVEPEESSLASVVFVLGRSGDGAESLSMLAAAGDLPKVEKKYNNAHAIHHHVSGVESPDSLVRDAARVGAGHSVLSVNLSELSSKLTPRIEKDAEEVEISQSGLMSKTKKVSHKRSQQLSDATVLIVSVDPRADSAVLDSAIVNAIEHESVSTVVLTAVRSHDEVKHERLMESRRKLSMMQSMKPHGRRLEDQQAEDDDAQNNNNQDGNNGDDMTGVYYVSMTPNILAGILFTLFFTVTTWIGVTCMGMITGQDVYVTKMPPVGREA